MPCWFLSDAIENIFSMVTAIFKKPTATTIAQALRIISINRFDFEPVTVMYGWDKTESLKIDYLKLLLDLINEETENISESAQDCEVPQLNNTDEVNYDDLFETELEQNVFFYEMAKILTKVVTKLNCNDCMSVLIDKDEVDTKYTHWIKDQEEFLKQGLKIPSRDAMRYFLRLESTFQQLVQIKSSHGANFHTCFELCSHEILVPNEHCITTSSKIVSEYIKSRMKIKLQCYLPHRANKHASKSLI
jgi:hypothetical protein